MKQRVLIFGGAGYIGGYLTDLLMVNTKKFDVTVYDALYNDERYLKPVKFIRGNDTNLINLINNINEYDTIVWTAFDDIELIKKILPGFNGKFVYFSSYVVYDAIDNNFVTELNSLCTEPEKYSWHQTHNYIEIEKYVQANADSYLIFRLGILYGMGDYYSHIHYEMINSTVFGAFQFQKCMIEDSSKIFPTIHIKDVGEAVLFGLLNDITGIYNLSNKNYTMDEIVEEINKLLLDHFNKTATIHYFNYERKSCKLSSAKYIDLGWKPLFNLKQGIRDIIVLLNEERQNFEYQD